MSFSSEQKEYIISHNIKSACCRRALLCGALYGCARAVDDGVLLHIEKKDVADYVAKLIREFYTKDVNIGRSSSGGRFYEIFFKTNSALDYLAKIEERVPFAEKCASCLSSFLKGVFLAVGKISDPESQYSLELSLGDRSIHFADLLSEYGVVPLISYKSSGTVVYFKSSSMIEEFCALAGLNKIVFAILNARAENEIKQNINRRINCETDNIAKAVEAAAKQIEVISALEKLNLLSSLPEELAQTARLRIEHSDLSLSQLAQIAVPPISKPGLSHRLKKIVELGSQLLSAHNKNSDL